MPLALAQNEMSAAGIVGMPLTAAAQRSGLSY